MNAGKHGGTVMIELAPSLLAADPLQYGNEIKGMLDEHVDILHFDVMDAHFVPNLSFSPALCKAIHQAFPDCRLDVHLMMDEPEKYLEAFARAGAAEITVHQEPVRDLRNMLYSIKALGVGCGVSVKPGTPAETLLPYLSQLDLILIMTVEPGFGGQRFMTEQVEKIRFLRENGYEGIISVDGGVNLENAKMLRDAGATRLVMGTAFFGADDKKQVVKSLKELA